ncbi:transposase [Desulfonema magnum]|uniref:Transposase family protein, IS4-like n=1 Tax=Desulfonema magnum TaxID=45655 RepID=A0A975GMC3_9BACT|nr:transposase [Desulfonema magnum]QTA86505.1 Transposase family protein, IS4-like [Desulfonema magnum]
MSDNKIRYREIRKSLEKLYPTQPQGNLARHLNTLAGMISGIVGSKSTQLPKIAEKVPDGTKEASREKKFKRWIMNDEIGISAYFLPFAVQLLLSLGLPEIVLAMDGSAAGRGCAILIVSVIYKKRALPLAWIVTEGGKGHFKEEDHICLIRQVHDMIPESGRHVVFLGDGEFDGTGLQETLSNWGWCYVCRTAPNVTYYQDDNKYQVDMVGCFMPPGFYSSVKNVLFTGKKYGPVTIVRWWEKKEPIFLVTNMKSAGDACEYYSKRFRIETFFSDQKSRGFNIH